MNRVKLGALWKLLLEEAASPTVGFSLLNWLKPGKDGPSMSCDTTVCALGLAALSGRFPELSFHERLDVLMPVHLPSGEDNYMAGSKTFGLPMMETLFLFSPASYDSGFLKGLKAKLEVTRRVDTFLSGVPLDEAFGYAKMRGTIPVGMKPNSVMELLR